MLFNLATVAALAGSAVAHMALSDPCPRFSSNCAKSYPLPAGVGYDYDIKSPIPYDGSLMKSTIRWPEAAPTWTAGQPVTVKFQSGGAVHGGGHCQFSISYDNGKTSAVVHEELRYCFVNGPSSSNSAEVLEYTFTLPADLPSSDSVVFSWSWLNSIGAREFYRDDADVKIVGSSSSYTGKQMTVVNHSGYPSVPEFAGNYDTGIDLYENAPQITISPSGSSAGTPSKPESSAAASSNYETQQPTASSNGPVGHTPMSSAEQAPTSSATHGGSHHGRPTHGGSRPGRPTHGGSRPARPTNGGSQPGRSADTPVYASSAPAPQETGSSCTNGDMQCASGGSGFQQCVWGTWSSTMSCASGTACKQSGNSIICDWA